MSFASSVMLKCLNNSLKQHKQKNGYRSRYSIEQCQFKVEKSNIAVSNIIMKCRVMYHNFIVFCVGRSKGSTVLDLQLSYCLKLVVIELCWVVMER